MRQFINNTLQGFIIGIANIIPGLSGSTMAIVLGVYEKLINIITKINYPFIKAIVRFDIKFVKNHISLVFLTSILIGIVISFITVAHLLNYLFEHHETYTWSYFFGIIIGSTIYIAKRIATWNRTELFFCIIGLVFALTLLFIEPLAENKNLFYVFFCGIIGIVGMLVPGLSGSYLLVVLGNYKLLLSTTIYHLTNTSLISDDNYMYVKIFITFILGKICGIITFSRLIQWLLKYYKNKTFALLTGFVGGSLIYIWPWKEEVINAKMIYSLTLPTFENSTDIFAIILIFIGIITISLIDYIAKHKNV